MNRQTVLVDTGPLSAIFSRHDAFHQLCKERLKDIKRPLLTCWPVITETTWLLRKDLNSTFNFLNSFSVGWIKTLPIDDSAIAWIMNYMKQYKDLKPQIADVALVYLAEHEGIEHIFTLDRRDFSVYRLSQNRNLKLLPESM